MDSKLLELLVCPVTKGPLVYDRDRQELVSHSARLAYPVRDGIPVLLENEARTLSDDELEEETGSEVLGDSVAEPEDNFDEVSEPETGADNNDE